MTATEELRRLLDERGVEYEGETDEDGWAYTRWHGFDDTGWLAASDELCGLLDLRGRYLFTPEQAIAATLGRGECDRLMTENAKLREQVADACMQLGGAWVRCTELRELVRFIMHQCNDGNPRCDECINWNDGECVALQRMRELGVEVDG